MRIECMVYRKVYDALTIVATHEVAFFLCCLESANIPHQNATTLIECY